MFSLRRLGEPEAAQDLVGFHFDDSKTAIVDGRYDRLQYISSVTHSAIYRARDLQRGQAVILDGPSFYTQEGWEESMRAFDTETEVRRRLGSHPHIEKTIEIARKRQHPYIVTETLDGLDLSKIGIDIRALVEYRPETFVIITRIALLLLDTLAYIHAKGVILGPEGLSERCILLREKDSSLFAGIQRRFFDNDLDGLPLKFKIIWSARPCDSSNDPRFTQDLQALTEAIASNLYSYHFSVPLVTAHFPKYFIEVLKRGAGRYTDQPHFNSVAELRAALSPFAELAPWIESFQLAAEQPWLL